MVLSVFATGVGVGLGALLVVMSRTRHAAAMLVGADEHAWWEARWPQRWRRIALDAVVVSFAVGGVAIVADLWFGVEGAFNLYLIPMFVLSLSASAFDHRTIRVTDAGLVIENSVARHLRPWPAVEDYTLTDRALIVRFGAPWRPALRFDRDDIETVDAVLTALDAALAERSRYNTRGRRPSTNWLSPSVPTCRRRQSFVRRRPNASRCSIECARIL